MRRPDILIGILFAGLGLGIMLEARTIPPMLGQAYGPGFFPVIVGFGLTLAGLILAVRAPLHAGRNHAVEVGEAPERPHIAALVWLLLGLVAIIWFFRSVGFVPILTVYLSVFMMILRVRPMQAVVVALLLTTAVYYVFGRFLLVPLPQGLLGGLF